MDIKLNRGKLIRKHIGEGRRKYPSKVCKI